MIPKEALKGNQNQWVFLRQIGEGDAGDVYQVESLFDKHQAILKRPRLSSFAPDTLRQASQIEAESGILKAINGLKISMDGYSLQPCALLDTSIPGNERSQRFFIVLEMAPGIDLPTIFKCARFGLEAIRPSLAGLDTYNYLFLEELAKIGKTPKLLLLRVLLALLDLLVAIHNRPVQWLDIQASGLLWNDVKPDHVFWDPQQRRLTVIDWGNGQFLNASGVSDDQHHSAVDDYRQYIDEVGRFLSESLPELFTELQWPASLSLEEANSDGLSSLRARIETALQVENLLLHQARQRENELLYTHEFNLDTLRELLALQEKLLAFGELPDYETASRLLAGLAGELAESDQWVDFNHLCERLASLPGSDRNTWLLLCRISQMLSSETEPIVEAMRRALKAGMKSDWGEMLWNLGLATRNDPDPGRWRELSSAVRRLAKEIDTDAPVPFLAINRLALLLEDEYERLRLRFQSPAARSETANQEHYFNWFESLVNVLRADILQRWTELDPIPPGADLSYSNLGEMLQELGQILPRLNASPSIRLETAGRAILQPIAHADIVLDAWRGKGFETGRRGLRQLFLWDPDRRRVLSIDVLLQEAPSWLEETRHGPQKGEKLHDYAIRMEFRARQYRALVGPAAWLETILGTFSELRNGARPGELATLNPALVDEFPWFKKFVRSSITSSHHTSQPGHEFSQTQLPPESKFGPEAEFSFGEPLDTWAPEARGSSARVFLGRLRQPNGLWQSAAVKVARADKLDYAVPLFWEESQVLAILRDLPDIAGLIECGFLRLEGSFDLPSEDDQEPASHLSGKILRLRSDQVELFANELSTRTGQGWLPYLAIECQDEQDSLLPLCDEGYTRGRYLQVEQGLRIAIQICEVLQTAHERDIVYRDHKIVHYYWNPIHRRVSVIDWNVAKWFPHGLSEAEIGFDLVQFSARALHHILAGRPAPGALPVGPTRPQEIEMAPHSYSVSWTYDDRQRLSEDLRQLLSRAVTGAYTSADELREDLLLQLPRE